MPKAEALHESRIGRAGNDRVDPLAMPDAQRLVCAQTQWPTTIAEQKALIFNFYDCIIYWIDIDTIFDLSVCCTPQQVQTWQDLVYHFQCDLVTEIDQWSNARTRCSCSCCGLLMMR